jgi:DNA polymerase III alpha subunit (gram-positive type)
MANKIALTPLRDADLSDPDAVMILDVETTGLNPDVGDILQCAIVDGNGDVLHNKFYDSWLMDWPEAYAVNRISKEMVDGLPCFEQECWEVTAILSKAKVIMGYNVTFDIGFLQAGGVRLPNDVQIVDVMQAYSEWANVMVLRRFSLSNAAKFIGLVRVNEHDALDDSQATLEIARFLQENARC